LSYDAVTCQVWLDVMPERPGSVQEICDLHVDRLTVPRGWMLCDRRVEEPAMFVTEPTPPPVRAHGPRTPASETIRLVPMVEPGLFDAPTRTVPDAAPPVPPRHPDDTSGGDTSGGDTSGGDMSGGDSLADGTPADDTLLRPSSPLLARAFRAAGTRPSVLSPRPDHEPGQGAGDDDGAAT